MKQSSQISKPEQELMNKIKELCPKAQTLRYRKIRMPDKPHIHGFQIDIYTPELRKGIEFDSTYWNSVAGLKKSRKTWPEDLIHYHKIKDKYFAKKGIEIIHIDEKEWMENPQACIEKVLSFLSSS